MLLHIINLKILNFNSLLLVNRNVIDFCMLILYPATFLNSFILILFNAVSGISMYIMSCHLWVEIVSLTPWPDLARTSSTLSNRSCESRGPCLASRSYRKSLSLVRMTLATGFLAYALFRVGNSLLLFVDWIYCEK